jgi:hypothetical protein
MNELFSLIITKTTTSLLTVELEHQQNQQETPTKPNNFPITSRNKAKRLTSINIVENSTDF